MDRIKRLMDLDHCFSLSYLIGLRVSLAKEILN